MQIFGKFCFLWCDVILITLNLNIFLLIEYRGGYDSLLLHFATAHAPPPLGDAPILAVFLCEGFP